MGFCIVRRLLLLIAGLTIGATGVYGQSYSILPGGVLPNAFAANSYSVPGCGPASWTASTTPTGFDVGPCIQAAVTAACAAGGGTVIIPASGTPGNGFGMKTAVVNACSGVHVMGAGVTYAGVNLLNASSHLIWEGSSSVAAMFSINNGSATNVPSAVTNDDVWGVLFDCNNICTRAFHFDDLSSTTFYGLGVARAGGASTTSGTGGPGGLAENLVGDTWINAGAPGNGNGSTGGNGNQNIQFYSLSCYTNNYASCFRFDSGGAPGTRTTTNTSQDNFWDIVMDLGPCLADGLVVGDMDNDNFWGTIRVQPGCAGGGKGPGRPIVVGNGGHSYGYVSPNGVSTNGQQQQPQLTFYHTSSGIAALGFQSGSSATITAGSASLITLSLTSNESTQTATSTGDADVLTFTGLGTNPGIVPGMVAIACYPTSDSTPLHYGPLGTGIPYNDPVVAVTTTSIQFLMPISAKYASSSNVACTFGYGIQATAAYGTGNSSGTYLAVYNSGETAWDLGTVPGGGTAQTAIAEVCYASACTLSFRDAVFVLSTTGTRHNGDTITLTTSVPAGAIAMLGTDFGNGYPLGTGELGVWGWQAFETQRIPLAIGSQKLPLQYMECNGQFWDCSVQFQDNMGQSGNGSPFSNFPFLGGTNWGPIGPGLNVQINSTNAESAVDGEILYGNVNCSPCVTGSKLVDIGTTTSGTYTSDFNVTTAGNATLNGSLTTTGVNPGPSSLVIGQAATVPITIAGGAASSNVSIGAGTNAGNLTLGNTSMTDPIALNNFMMMTPFHGTVGGALPALPTCAAGYRNTVALVSDATTPTYNGTYTSGGAVTALVVCNASNNWVTF